MIKLTIELESLIYSLVLAAMMPGRWLKRKDSNPFHHILS